MRTKHLSGSIAAMALLAGCTHVAGDGPASTVGTARLTFADGQPAGVAKLVQAGDHFQLTVSVIGLPVGEHGIHLHETGQCLGPDFKSAGGHLNPQGRTHGALSHDPQHLGDLPNLRAATNGTASAEVDLPGAAGSTLGQIFDRDGTAVVIHADRDDYRSDPAGNAGARIACGVLQPAG